MTRTLLFSAVFALSAATCALAQSQTPPADAPPAAPADGGAGVRSGNITSTGETVPNPGASQSAGTTSLDRGIQHEDNKITSSICKGC